MCSTIGSNVSEWITDSSKSYSTTCSWTLQTSWTFDSLDSSITVAIKWIESGISSATKWGLETFKLCQEWWVYLSQALRQHLLIVYLTSVLSTMNSKYRTTLSESKKLNASGLLQKATANHITADKILYDHAIQMVIKRADFDLVS